MKKIFAAILAALMICAGLSGCGQSALIFDDQQFNAPHFITLPVAGEQKERFLK